MLEWFDGMSTPLVGDLLKRWPQLPALQKASQKTLRKFFAQHNCRSEERIQQRLDQIGQAVPATTDAALLNTGDLCIHIAVHLLAALPLALPSLTVRSRLSIRRIRTVLWWRRCQELDRR